MSKYIIVEAPKDWVAAMCPDCHIQYSDCNGICGESVCPLAKAQEVVEVWDIEQYGRANTHDQFYHDKDGIPVKLYARKVEEKNK